VNSMFYENYERKNVGYLSGCRELIQKWINGDVFFMKVAHAIFRNLVRFNNKNLAENFVLWK
jgi:hypothetical protein